MYILRSLSLGRILLLLLARVALGVLLLVWVVRHTEYGLLNSEQVCEQKVEGRE